MAITMAEVFLLHPKHAPILQGDRKVLKPNDLDGEVGCLRTFVLGMFIPAVCLGILWLFAVVAPGMQADWDQHARTTQAVVTSCEIQSGGSNSQSHDAVLAYDYTVDGTSYHSSSRVSFTGPNEVCRQAAPGATVEIEYLPDSPSETTYNRRQANANGQWLLYLFSIVGLIGLGGGLYTLYGRRRTILQLQRLRDKGRLLFGTMTSFELSKIQKSGGRLATLTYEFTTPTGQSVKRVIKAPSRKGFDSVYAPQTIAILYVDDTLYKPL
jgi:hypothetical protein